MDEYYTYTDFLIPVRISSRKLITKKFAIFLLLELLTLALVFILISSLFPSPSGFNSGGSRPFSIPDILVLLSWPLIAGFYFNLFDQKYQRP